MDYKGRMICKGKAKAKALVSDKPISFYGGVDVETGCVSEHGHPLEGKCITGKVLVFPRGSGSTVGSYALYQMSKTGKAPAAMVNEESEPIVAVGAIISGIPLVDQIPKEFFEKVKDDAEVEVDAEASKITL